jgi:hypothetical protein
MSLISNDIVLRPRFQLKLHGPSEHILNSFEKVKKAPFLVKRLDDHVFIKLDHTEIHFWSPQLHLEIITEEGDTTKLYGVFGPNPTLWTFFMFLHFGVATLFIILGIWAYSSASLNKPYGLQLGLMALMVLFWFVLYAFGRLGKKKGRIQMEQLYAHMKWILSTTAYI